MLNLYGAFTALVTPFTSTLAVDDVALGKLVHAQLAAGIAGLVPMGTTGESPTLDDDEHIGVIEKVVQLVASSGRKVPVIGGTGSNATREAVNLSLRAVAVGADAVMIVMPYYNKPTQAGLVLHAVTVAKAVGSTPVVLYNVPGRTASDLAADSVEEICSAAPNVIAIKEATGNVLRAQELVRRLGNRLTVLSGDDALTLGMMACGAKGVISVTSNLLPAAVQNVTELMAQGDVGAARKAHLRLLPVHDVMFLESNPGPVKGALVDDGLLGAYVRPPLVMPTESTRMRVREIVKTYRAG